MTEVASRGDECAIGVGSKVVVKNTAEIGVVEFCSGNALIVKVSTKEFEYRFRFRNEVDCVYGPHIGDDDYCDNCGGGGTRR